MLDAIGTSLSGMNAASTRLSVSSHNVANQNSTLSMRNGDLAREAYAPQQVVQSSVETGGVRANVRTKDNATFKIYAPDSVAADESGIVEMPNVDPAEEVINQVTASYDYKANLKAIRVADEMLGSLLDIRA